MKKRLLATFLSMAMVAGLATGCSTPGGGKDGGASDGEKVFRYATNTLPTTLDPNKGQGMVDNEIQHAITEGLVRNTGGDIQPGIAESWDISDDGLMYTFHLRDDAVWSDGEPVTAANFEYSWKRLVNPETASAESFEMLGKEDEGTIAQNLEGLHCKISCGFLELYLLSFTNCIEGLCGIRPKRDK